MRQDPSTASTEAGDKVPEISWVQDYFSKNTMLVQINRKNNNNSKKRRVSSWESKLFHGQCR